MNQLRRFVSGRKTAWIVVVLFAIGSAFLMANSEAASNAPVGTGLAESVESARVAALQEKLGSADTTTAIVVFHRDGKQLTKMDLSAIDERGAQLAPLSSSEVLPPVSVADDTSAALLAVPLEAISEVSVQADRADDIRSIANDDLPSGLTALMTGPEGFSVDLAAVFSGANFTLLLTTVIVVAVLLILTYRSPWLWLVPLAVIGIADAVAGTVARWVSSMVGLEVDASITGILSVLVFGAGTNYALLLIARYRDELRRHDDRHEAMAAALAGAGPAIIASGSTVVLSLLTLLFAELTGNRSLGLACAAGIVVAMVFALVVLPATLVLFGRGLFWPYVPHFGSPSGQGRGFWFTLGTRVSRKPALVAVVGLLVLGGFAAVVPQVQVGLAQTERFTSTPEAVTGQQVIAEAFSAGSGSPTIVIADADAADEVADVASRIPEVNSAVVGETNGTITQVNVSLDAAAETDKAFALVEKLRTELHAIPGANALVGGIDAEAHDVAQAQSADQALVIPLILVIVFIVLVLLLRALAAPVLLLLTVVGSYFASVGASWLLFRSVFDFPALDQSVLLFSFLFLVALGVDYNIFLVTRAKEESDLHRTRPGMIRALSATGGVITSAGILLAAVFAVLGVLPLITLTQIGIIVCVGVLIDTLLVRTVIVPALAFLTGDAFWWPRKPVTGRPRHTRESDDDRNGLPVPVEMKG